MLEKLRTIIVYIFLIIAAAGAINAYQQCQQIRTGALEPIADPGEPCIALIVVEKPIILTGPWGRWLNPLVSRGLI